MGESQTLEWLGDLPLEIEVAISGPTIRLKDVLGLTAGSVVATGVVWGETLDVFAGGARIGDSELSNYAGRTHARMVHFGGERNG